MINKINIFIMGIKHLKLEFFFFKNTTSLIHRIFVIFMILFASCTNSHSENSIKSIEIYDNFYRELAISLKAQNLNNIGKLIKLHKLDVNHTDSIHGVSLLNWCMFNEKEKSYRKLLELGANPNFQDTLAKFAPPITEAAQEHTSVYLQLALKYGGNPNIQSKKILGSENQTPLLASILPIGFIDNMVILIANGADVNLISHGSDEDYSSPLAQALIVGEIQKGKYLIEHGADYKSAKLITVEGKEVGVLYFLRHEIFSINSKEYKMKLDVINYLKQYGLDYWKEPIPQSIKETYKDNPDFLSKY